MKPPPDQFTVQCFDDGRCYAVSIDHWSLQAGRTLARTELRVADLDTGAGRRWGAHDAAPAVALPVRRVIWIR